MLAIKEDVDREDRLKSLAYDESRSHSKIVIHDDEEMDELNSVDSESFRAQALKILETYNARLAKTGPSQF